jgi:hypothetical protein
VKFSAQKEREETFSIFEGFSHESEKFDFLIYFQIELCKKLFGKVFFMEIQEAIGEKEKKNEKLKKGLGPRF